MCPCADHQEISPDRVLHQSCRCMFIHHVLRGMYLTYCTPLIFIHLSLHFIPTESCIIRCNSSLFAPGSESTGCHHQPSEGHPTFQATPSKGILTLCVSDESIKSPNCLVNLHTNDPLCWVAATRHLCRLDLPGSFSPVLGTNLNTRWRHHRFLNAISAY